MRRHTRIMLFMLLVMLLALTGCEKTYTGNADTQTSSDSEELTETVQETETNPETVRESVESDKVTEGSTQNKKVFESSLGYSVIYDDTVFEYNRTGDYDEIGLRGQTFSSKPVFFAAMKIKNEDIRTVMNQIFNNSAQQTTIGIKAYSAICQPTTEEVDGGKNLKYHNQYLVELANGDALLFEVQWFEENKNFKETEAKEEREVAAETERVRERIQRQQLKAAKKLSLRVPARSCQRCWILLRLGCRLKARSLRRHWSRFMNPGQRLSRLKKQRNNIDLYI